MPDAAYQQLLDQLLDSWDRNNMIVLNLLRVLPEGALDARAIEGSQTVGELFAHIHFVRLIFVHEDAPDIVVELPNSEREVERDRDRMAQKLNVSAMAVRDAVSSRIASGRQMVLHFDHPMLMFQHLIWHEGYHHGQIKLALNRAGLHLDDAVVGPLSWGVWMNKRASRTS